jgi:hypothetical protein
MKKAISGLLITLVLFFGLAPTMIAESDEIEYIDVDLAYLAQNIEEFLGMPIRTNGTVKDYATICEAPSFWLGELGNPLGVVTDSSSPTPPIHSIVIVEGWVYIYHCVEGGSVYRIYADSVVQIHSTIDIDLNSLHLKSSIEGISCYIELPEGYDVGDIDVSSIRLNNTIPVDQDASTLIGDYDNDTIPDLMVKFNRTKVSEFIEYVQGVLYGNVTLTVSCKVDAHGTENLFEGSDTISVLLPGDVDNDGDVDWFDFGLFAEAYGSNVNDVEYNWFADFNEDQNIDWFDFSILAEYYGKTAI